MVITVARIKTSNEPRRDITNKVTVHPAKTQSSLDILAQSEHKIRPANKSQLTQKIASSFLLNIAEHENAPANKCENANSC